MAAAPTASTPKSKELQEFTTKQLNHLEFFQSYGSNPTGKVTAVQIIKGKLTTDGEEKEYVLVDISSTCWVMEARALFRCLHKVKSVYTDETDEERNILNQVDAILKSYSEAGNSFKGKAPPCTAPPVQYNAGLGPWSQVPVQCNAAPHHHPPPSRRPTQTDLSDKVLFQFDMKRPLDEGAMVTLWKELTKNRAADLPNTDYSQFTHMDVDVEGLTPQAAQKVLALLKVSDSEKQNENERKAEAIARKIKEMESEKDRFEALFKFKNANEGNEALCSLVMSKMFPNPDESTDMAKDTEAFRQKVSPVQRNSRAPRAM